MGPVNPLVTDVPPVDYFHKLTIPDKGRNLFQILVEETNRYAYQFLSNPQYSPFQELYNGMTKMLQRCPPT